MSRDPNVLGRNVRAFRALRRWGIRELAERSGVSVKTIVKVERGEGCTIRTEQKIADGLSSLVGRLWDANLLSDESERVIRKDDGRWFFGDPEDASRYNQRLVLSRPDLGVERFRSDPDEIQEEEERLRLGHAGLASVFFKPLGGGVSSGYFKYSLCEIYAADYTPPDIFDYAFMAFCTRGSVCMRIRDRNFELEEGDSILYHGRDGYWIEPSSSVSSSMKPPTVSFVCLGVLALPKGERFGKVL